MGAFLKRVIFAPLHHTDHIQPVLDVLKPLHNFTIESQVQYYAPLAFEVQPTEDGVYGLSYEDLTVFVNSAEWTLCA